MNRRDWLLRVGMAVGALAPQSSLMAALATDEGYRANIGLQLYTIRKAIEADPVAAMRVLAEAGYRQVEPYGFMQADAMMRAAVDAGLAVHSAHFQWDCVVKPSDAGMSDFQKVLEKAHAQKLKHLVVPYLQDDVRRGLDDYKKLADQFNQAAVLAKKAGVQLSYHNHNFEFAPLEGGMSGYDVFMERFAPEMKFEVDVFWVKVAGLEPVELLQRLKGRVSQLHLKDLKAGVARPYYKTDVPADAFQELGNGVIEMVPIIAAARLAGVEHCHVEQDQSPDALASVQQSLTWLRQQ